MITLSAPQIWTVLGILAAAFASMVVVMTQLMTRAMDSNFAALSSEIRATHGILAESHKVIESVKSELSAQIEVTRSEMAVRFEQVDRRFTEIDRRFERLEKQVDNLDGDVQAISRKVFPD